MGTRAAAFTAKIRNLQDFYLRTLHGVVPLPSGIDIANTLKYYCQLLRGVLKDVPDVPFEMLHNPSDDENRLSLFPNLEYDGLYRVVVQLIDIVPLVQYGVHQLGQVILQTLACLMPFLQRSDIDHLPYLVASTLQIYPSSLHKDILDSLCMHILPFTMGRGASEGNPAYGVHSMAPVLMLVFQYVENSAYHCQLLETVLALKPGATIRELLCVVAHGTPPSRAPAANLLFHYWPNLNPSPYDRRDLHVKFTGWNPYPCGSEQCVSAGAVDACKMIIDQRLVANLAPDAIPPLYLCEDCAGNQLPPEQMQYIQDTLMPMEEISMACENKSCRSSDKIAVATCFDLECASYNGNVPIRYCHQCYSIRHNTRRGQNHPVHLTITLIGLMDQLTAQYFVEAIVSLLKEAVPNVETEAPHMGVNMTNELQLPIDERRHISRFGIWLLVGHCKPVDQIPRATLGRLLSVLFHWFDATAYLLNEQIGNQLERLKADYILPWLTEVRKTREDVLLSCLIPHPPEYAKVGGHWDRLVTKAAHIKAGFSRMFCLVPYEIITANLWNYLMPYWMEALSNEILPEQLSEFRTIFSKVLDPEMSPLGFDSHQMYNFISQRFKQGKPKAQEQPLLWLQILSELNIMVPLHLLFEMFMEGVGVLKENMEDEAAGATAAPVDEIPEDIEVESQESKKRYLYDESKWEMYDEEEEEEQNEDEDEPPEDNPVTCHVYMLDVVLKQLELHEVVQHGGVEHFQSRQAVELLQAQLDSEWVHEHASDVRPGDCSMCHVHTLYLQLAHDVLQYICPENPPILPDFPEDDSVRGEDGKGKSSPDEDGGGTEMKPSGVVITLMDPLITCGEIPSVPLLPRLQKAHIETMGELHMAAAIPTERVVRAIARAVTLTEADVAGAKASVAAPVVVGENDEPIPSTEEEEGTFWHTSQGKFKFSLEDLSPQLRLVHTLLQRLSESEDPEVVYGVIRCLHLLVLHAEVLAKGMRLHRGYVIWCQENLIIYSLWELLEAEHSHIACLVVPMLLHCLSLPAGAPIFWKLIERDFHSTNWQDRFIAVERVTLLGRFLDGGIVRHSSLVQGAIANSYCFLISMLDDVNTCVSVRTDLYFDTIKDNSLKVICWCLEQQWDAVVVDRPIILQKLYHLYNTLRNRPILSWSFFLNRFHRLLMESMGTAGMRSGRDTGTMLGSDWDPNTKTMSVSASTKWPYKRTMSAPAGILETKPSVAIDKDKIYNRQASVPMIKRKGSKMWPGGPSYTYFMEGHPQPGTPPDDVISSIADMDDPDRETTHLLVFLFMQFLTRPDQAYPTDDKKGAKTLNTTLKHMYSLMGYSSTEKLLLVQAQKLRSSPVFNAFLNNLPLVLDHNLKMGSLIAGNALSILGHAVTGSRRVASGTISSNSLWLLEKHQRHSWLNALLVFLYKYRYGSEPLASQVKGLVRVVLNTLENGYKHQCLTPEQLSQCGTAPSTHGTVTHQPTLSRETSQTSFSLEFLGSAMSPRHRNSDIVASRHSEVTTLCPSEVRAVYQKPQFHIEDTPWRSKSKSDFSVLNEDNELEPELEAIPESPKSESETSSVRESMNELGTLEEAQPIEEMARSERSEGLSAMTLQPTEVKPCQRGQLITHEVRVLETAETKVREDLHTPSQLKGQTFHYTDSTVNAAERPKDVEVIESDTGAVAKITSHDVKVMSPPQIMAPPPVISTTHKDTLVMTAPAVSAVKVQVLGDSRVVKQKDKVSVAEAQGARPKHHEDVVKFTTYLSGNGKAVLTKSSDSRVPPPKPPRLATLQSIAEKDPAKEGAQILVHKPDTHEGAQAVIHKTQLIDGTQLTCQKPQVIESVQVVTQKSQPAPQKVHILEDFQKPQILSISKVTQRETKIAIPQVMGDSRVVLQKSMSLDSQTPPQRCKDSEAVINKPKPIEGLQIVTHRTRVKEDLYRPPSMETIQEASDKPVASAGRTMPKPGDQDDSAPPFVPQPRATRPQRKASHIITSAAPDPLLEPQDNMSSRMASQLHAFNRSFDRRLDSPTLEEKPTLELVERDVKLMERENRPSGTLDTAKPAKPDILEDLPPLEVAKGASCDPSSPIAASSPTATGGELIGF